MIFKPVKEIQAAPSTVTAIEARKNMFAGSLSGKKIFEYFYLKWRTLVYLIFLSDGAAPKRRGALGNLSPYPPLSTKLKFSKHQANIEQTSRKRQADIKQLEDTACTRVF